MKPVSEQALPEVIKRSVRRGVAFDDLAYYIISGSYNLG